jgi:hypothetical protein
MKRYKIYAAYDTYCEAVIEAESEDQAYDIAKQMDGGSFTSRDSGDWRILDVEEVDE